MNSPAVYSRSRPHGRLASHHLILSVDVHSELVQCLQRLAMESAEDNGAVVQATLLTGAGMIASLVPNGGHP